MAEAGKGRGQSLGAVARWACLALRFYRTRTLLAILAIALPTCLLATSIGFKRGYEDSLTRNIQAMGYQVLVTGKGCPHEAATLILRGGSIPMYIREPVFRHVVGQPEVDHATGFLLQAGLAADGNSQQMFMGVDEAFRQLRPGLDLQRGAWFTASSQDQAVLGYNVAEFLRLRIGDPLPIGKHQVRVCGVLHRTGTQDDGTVFLPLGLAQNLFGKRDRLTGIGIRLEDISTAGDLIERLYDVPSIQVVRMSQVQGMMINILRGVQGVILLFATLCFLVAMVGVFNASLVAISERGDEMGLLRGLGCPSVTLFALVLSEALLTGLGGGLAGVVLTVLLRSGFVAIMRARLAFVPAGTTVVLDPWVLISCAAGATLLAFLAGIYPASKACRVAPAQTMQRRSG